MNDFTNSSNKEQMKTKQCTRCKKEYPEDSFINNDKIYNNCELCRYKDRQKRLEKTQTINQNKTDGKIICNECLVEKDIICFKRGNKIYKNCSTCREKNNIYNKTLFNKIKEEAKKGLKENNKICRVCNKQFDKIFFIQNNIEYETCINCLIRIQRTTEEYNKIKIERCKPGYKFCCYCKTEKLLECFIGKYKEETKACHECIEKYSYNERIKKEKEFIDKTNNNNDPLSVICTTCLQSKPLEEFIIRNKQYNNCELCRKYKADKKLYSRRLNPEKDKEMRNKYIFNDEDKIKNMIYRIINKEYFILNSSLKHAKYKNIKHNITIYDILKIFPVDYICPIVNESFVFNETYHDLIMSIDRIDSSLGYIPGNVQIISYIANSIKSDCTLTQLERLLNGFTNYKTIEHNIDNITMKDVISYRKHLVVNQNKRRIDYVLNIEKHMVKRCRLRAIDKNLSFDLDENYIKSIWQLDNKCPILGYNYFETNTWESSPSIDRIDNSKGYTKDNIRVISNKANMIKSKYTLYQLEKVIKGFRNYYDKTGTGIIL